MIRTRSLLPAVVLALWSLQAGAAPLMQVPPPGTFQLRAGLAQAHPRLHFTAADVPALRAKATTSRKWYLDKAKQAFGGYVGKPAVFANDWKDYLYGFWGQFAFDMFWVVEQDPKWRDTAKSWALYFARNSTLWLADDLVPMDITSGMALTYDLLYDQFTEAERRELRAALFKAADYIYARFFVDQYWTGDFQNNHLHNRVHGLAHAAFAIYGDDPAVDVQKHADLAVWATRQIADWLPDDGSCHEGPGYWDYGYHWVVRGAQLVGHVTGTDPTAGKPHYAQDLYFRAYLTTPGWTGTFGIGDSGSGEPANMEAIAPAVAREQDAHGAAILRELMAKAPGGFYQQAAWGLLWYDGDLAAKPYAELPLARFWPDLEMVSARSGWDADATALVFKSGPPGGHRMQQLRQPDWFNVAHDHPDQLHFLLFAHGKMLAEDDGYPKEKKLTRSHNTLLVDGLGQPRDGDGWYQPFDYAKTGTVDDVLLTGSTVVATGNASTCYAGAQKVVRHLAFVEGGYLVLVDELEGADAADHDFEWRLHKAGTWTKRAAGQFAVADGDVALDVRFLEPTGAALQDQFLPAELTAPPCLAAKTRGKTARFVSVLVPQKAGAPSIPSETVAATGGVAVRATNGTAVDLFAVATSGAVEFGGWKADGAEALVRTDAAATRLAVLVRGTSLSKDGKALLQASAAANLAWRPEGRGGTLEAEAPYKSSGGATQIAIGGLEPGDVFKVERDGVAVANAKADVGGVVALSLDLTKRRVARLTQVGNDPPVSGADGGSVGDSDGGAASGSDAATNPPGGATSACGCATAASGALPLALALVALVLRRRGRA